VAAVEAAATAEIRHLTRSSKSGPLRAHPSRRSPNDEGAFQVAKGGVYSYYEFWQDPSDRLTDEQWRSMLNGGNAPERPDWFDVFLVR